MGYSEFDIDSVIAQPVQKKRIVLAGVQSVGRIYKSNSTSTEEFAVAAIADLGVVERNVMFVNSMHKGLADRLQIASGVASKISAAKAQGREGFVNKEVLNPWSYAIEGSAKEFFKRIWDAIKSACRRIITAIANLIKRLGVAIESIDVKSQIRDYETYKKNKAVITRAKKNVSMKTFIAMNWKVDAAGIGKLLKKASAHYVKMFRKTEDEALLERASREDLAKLKTPDDFAKSYSKIFGSEGSGIIGKIGKNVFHQGAKDKIGRIVEKINQDMAAGVTDVFGKISVKNTPSNIVWGSLTTGGKSVKMTVAQMEKLSGDFACLSKEWLAINVKDAVASVTNAERQFTQFTKTIDQLAAKFDKVSTQENGVSSLSNLTSQLANARIRYNGFYTGIMLELQTGALRFRRNAHAALKMILSGSPKSLVPATKTKSKESLNDDFFEFV